MSSAKKIYAANVYASNVYAAGIFRGLGTSSALIGRWTQVVEIIANRKRVELERGPRAEAT